MDGSIILSKHKIVHSQWINLKNAPIYEKPICIRGFLVAEIEYSENSQVNNEKKSLLVCSTHTSNGSHVIAQALNIKSKHFKILTNENQIGLKQLRQVFNYL